MLPPGKLIKHALPMEARKNNCAPNVVAQTLLSADCLRGAFGAGDSSRRAGTLYAALQEGRDESRPGRQECLRHIGTALSLPSDGRECSAPSASPAPRPKDDETASLFISAFS